MMRIRRNGMRAALLTLAMLLVFGTSLAAGDGRLSVRVHSGDTNVQYAVIELYRIGDARIANASRTFTIGGAFAGSGETLSDLKDKGLPERLLKYAQDNGIAPDYSAATSEDGRAVFSNLPEGAYLVCQNGFEKTCYFTEIEPFVVTLPMTVNGEWSYHVTAEPKADVVTRPTATPAPTEGPSDSKLPQSGLLRWPVIALSVGGVVLFAMGWTLWFMGKRKRNA